MPSIEVTYEPDVVEERTIHMPQALAPDERPARALIWKSGQSSTPKQVVRMRATRPGSSKATASLDVLESIGGKADGLICEYRKAGVGDLLRYDAGARSDSALAVLTALTAAAAAWLVVDKAAGTETGARWTVAVLVFVGGLLVTTLKLRKELRDLGP